MDFYDIEGQLVTSTAIKKEISRCLRLWEIVP